MASSLDVTRVSSAAITSQPFSTSSARKRDVAGIADGGGQDIKPRRQIAAYRRLAIYRPASKGLSSRVKGLFRCRCCSSCPAFVPLPLALAIAACAAQPPGPAAAAPAGRAARAHGRPIPWTATSPAYLRLPGMRRRRTPVRVGVILPFTSSVAGHPRPGRRRC